MALSQTISVFFSWRDSLKIFQPPHLKLFLLLALNSWRQMWQSLITSPALVLYILLMLSAAMHDFGAYLAYSAMVALLCAATRPSVYLKSFIYYLYAGLLGLLLSLLFLALQLGMQWLNLGSLGTLTPAGEPLIGQLVTIYIIILLLFLLDTQKRIVPYITAFWRALIMIIYNLPLFMIISFCAYVGNIFGESVMGRLPDTRITMLGIIMLFSLIMSFYICLLTNFYVKRIHEQFDVYY